MVGFGFVMLAASAWARSVTAARSAAVRLLPAGARAWLAGAVAVGLAQAVLLVAQAGILARQLTGAFYGGISGHAVTGYCAAIASLALGQALFTWAWEACTEAAARRTRAAVRRWALAAALDPVSPIGLAGTAGPVARSLAGPRPRLWLLDEPTSGLDPAGVRRLVAELSRIIDGTTAIIATHDPSAAALGQQTIELRHGRLRPGCRAAFLRDAR